MPRIFFLEVHITLSFFELPVPPDVLLGLSGRGYCLCPLVKITAQNIQPEMKRRKQKIGSEDKPTAFGPCCLLQACRRAFRLPLSPPPALVARGSGAGVSTGPDLESETALLRGWSRTSCVSITWSHPTILNPKP